MCKKILLIVSILTLSMFIMCCGDDTPSNNTNSSSSETNNSSSNSTSSRVDNPSSNKTDDVSSSNDGTDNDNIYNDKQEINSELSISYPKSWTLLSETDNSYLIDNVTTTNLVYKKLDSSKEEFITNLKNELVSYNLIGNIEEGSFTSKSGYVFSTLSFNAKNGDINSYEKQYILFSKEYSYIFTINSSSSDSLNNNLSSYENFINRIILK